MQIRRIEIEPAENGGHTVTHHYKEEPRKNSRSHAGVAMEYHEPEHHVFGKEEGHEMLAHLANHLGIAEPKDAAEEHEEEAVETTEED
jgi:hypothetical protein